MEVVNNFEIKKKVLKCNKLMGRNFILYYKVVYYLKSIYLKNVSFVIGKLKKWNEEVGWNMVEKMKKVKIVIFKINMIYVFKLGVFNFLLK